MIHDILLVLGIGLRKIRDIVVTTEEKQIIVAPWVCHGHKGTHPWYRDWARW